MVTEAVRRTLFITLVHPDDGVRSFLQDVLTRKALTDLGIRVCVELAEGLDDDLWDRLSRFPADLLIIDVRYADTDIRVVKRMLRIPHSVLFTSGDPELPEWCPPGHCVRLPITDPNSIADFQTVALGFPQAARRERFRPRVGHTPNRFVVAADGMQSSADCQAETTDADTDATAAELAESEQLAVATA